MAKAPIKKKAAKVSKKTAIKKKATAKKAATKKTARKKSVVTKKKATGRKRSTAQRAIKTPVPKKTVRKKTATNTRKRQRPEKVDKIVPETDLPQVEEKSPATHAVTDNLPDMTIKERQRDAVRNYDNHNIRLSSTKKGGSKPAGKKPLW